MRTFIKSLFRKSNRFTAPFTADRWNTVLCQIRDARSILEGELPEDGCEVSPLELLAEIERFIDTFISFEPSDFEDPSKPI